MTRELGSRSKDLELNWLANSSSETIKQNIIVRRVEESDLTCLGS